MIRILLTAFTLNFLWEISQSFLYAPHAFGTADVLWTHIRAGMGDVVFVLLVLMPDRILFDGIPSKDMPVLGRAAFIMILGYTLAVIVERYALAVGRWSYADLMPIIPFFEVGLIPVLQMMLIPPLVFLVDRTIFSKTT